ncbi:hypothetical protein KPL42_09770 [Clostridium gasigenes]|uniref:hypothetical protein n=1 Tax=Clostridium gasigenes TaxID=94869 RepID=UPI001C0E4051|nr:hypothetical protein [Clostridium gasigenes]MBU3088777.1 hypothetical protein [Clostridium gasigenes]
MLNIFLTSFKVSFVEGANSFIYLLSKLPLIGKKIPESLYKETKVKMVLGLIKYILSLFSEFFRKGLYLAVFVGIPTVALTKGRGIEVDTERLYIHIYFILSFMAGSLLNSMLLKVDKDAYNMITLMRVDPKKYYLGQIIYKIISQSIFLSPLMLINIGFKKTLIVLLTLGAFRILGETVVLFIFSKYKVVLGRNKVLPIVLILVAPIFAYLLPFFNIILGEFIILNPISICIIIVLGFLAASYLWNSKSYTALSKRLISKGAIFNDGENLKGVVFADVAINEKSIDIKTLNSKKLNKKSGYDYLNSIFFNRHKKIVINAIRNRVVIIGVATVASVILLLIFPNYKEKVAVNIIKASGYLVFVMYMISTTQRICKAMFFNCDISLLRYGYYKDPKAILDNFRVRLKRVVLYNLIPSVTICLGLTIIIIFCGKAYSIIELLPIFLAILGLSGFFSIYHLFMYYIVQPYTKDLTIKSPLFHISNFIVYMVSYQALQIKVATSYFTLVVIVITMLFIPIALFTIYKMAPKTFKLK